MNSYKMLIPATALAALTLFGGTADGAVASAYSAAYQPGGDSWTIGPVIRGRNYSQGVAPHPVARRDGTWHIDIPEAPGSVRYVTFPHGSLAGKRRIVMRYRIEAARGVRIAARTAPQWPGLITPYFQRSGDNWTARGRYEAYRWYATFATKEIAPGEHQIVAPLNGRWTATETSNSHGNPHGFQDALVNADQVGFVLGGGDGYGHGIHATGPARLVVTSFRVE